jgi:hypothetical protein
MIDKFAHKNIHGPREKGHMSEEEIHNKKVSGDNLSENILSSPSRSLSANNSF